MADQSEPKKPITPRAPSRPVNWGVCQQCAADATLAGKQSVLRWNEKQGYHCDNGHVGIVIRAGRKAAAKPARPQSVWKAVKKQA